MKHSSILLFVCLAASAVSSFGEETIGPPSQSMETNEQPDDSARIRRSIQSLNQRIADIENKSATHWFVNTGIPVIACFFTLIGLVFTATRSHQLTESLQRTAYLTSLDRYFDLKKMTIDNVEIRNIFDSKEMIATPSPIQLHFIYMELAFAESLYLTNQIDAFPDVDGGSWDIHIRQIFSNPTIQGVWAKEVASPEDSPYADAFIRFVTRKLSSIADRDG